MVEQILEWILWEILLFNLTVFPLLFYYFTKQNRNFSFIYANNVCFYVFLLILFCVFDKSSGDYFHYLQIVNDVYHSRSLLTHLEDFYIWLISAVDGDYLSFRFLIWGSGIILFSFTVKRFELEKNVTYIYFALYTLLSFSYTRVFLALCLFFLGFSFVVKTNSKKIINRVFESIFGLFLILFSLFFHKSIIILIVLFPFAFIKLNKKIVFLLLTLFPVFVAFMDQIIANFLFANSDMAGGSYLLMDKREESVITLIYRVLYFSSFFLLFFKMSRIILFSKNENIPFYVKKLYNLIFIILYVSFLLSFLSFGDPAISYRIRNMAFVPFAFILSYFDLHKYFSRMLMLFSLLLIILADNCYLFYLYYIKSVLGL